MTDSIPIEIIRVPVPDKEVARKIREITRSCNAMDGTNYSWDDGGEFLNKGGANTFLAFSEKELTGWLQIFGPRKSEGEITVLVRPDFRRLGIAGRLLNAARNELGRRNASSLLLVCDAAGAEGLAMAEAAGSVYEYSEFLMRYLKGSRESANEMRAVAALSVTLEPAAPEDRDRLAAINLQAFPSDATMDGDKGCMVDEFYRSDRRSLFRICFNGETAGMIGIYDGDPEAYIHGFAISREFRGRGIGRQALRSLVDWIQKSEPRRPIELEVQTDNVNALELYESVGFSIIAEFRYYRSAI